METHGMAAVVDCLVVGPSDDHHGRADLAVARARSRRPVAQRHAVLASGSNGHGPQRHAGRELDVRGPGLNKRRSARGPMMAFITGEIVLRKIGPMTGAPFKTAIAASNRRFG